MEEKTQEDEGDIRELLVIYLNQLNPSTGVLYDAFSATGPAQRNCGTEYFRSN